MNTPSVTRENGFLFLKNYYYLLMAALGLDCCTRVSLAVASRRYSSFGCSGLMWGFSFFTQSLGTHLE